MPEFFFECFYYFFEIVTCRFAEGMEMQTFYAIGEAVGKILVINPKT